MISSRGESHSIDAGSRSLQVNIGVDSESDDESNTDDDNDDIHRISNY